MAHFGDALKAVEAGEIITMDGRRPRVTGEKKEKTNGAQAADVRRRSEVKHLSELRRQWPNNGEVWNEQDGLF